MNTKIRLTIVAFITSQYCASLAAETLPDKTPITKIETASSTIRANPVEALVESNDFERITITANRKESLDTDLAMSVHSVGKEELGLDNGQHVAESLNSLSGVLIDQLSGGQGHKTSIRMPMNTSGYYLYLQDNIPLQSPAFFNHNALWWSSFNSNVSRMEVLKGAGTALYGSGAVAATINILSADVAEQAETSMDLMLGKDKYSKVQFSHSNKISDNQGFRVAVSYLDNEGWREHTGSKRAEVTFRHELEISNNQRLVTSFVISDLEQEMAASLSEDLYKNDKTDSGLSEDVLAIDPLRKTKYMRLSTQWDKTDGNHFYSLIPYYRLRTNDYTATWNQNMPKVESEVQSFGLLALASLEHNDNSETIIGADIEFTEGEQLSYQPLDFTTSGWGADTFIKGEKFYDDTTKYTGLSPYIQHHRTLSENLDLTLGARYDYAKYKFENHLGTYGDIGHGKLSLENRDDDFSHLSPKASLNYHLGEYSSVYLRYANSFRLPTAGSLYHLTTKDDGNAKAVDPEVSDTYEVGYKVNLETVNFDFALYYMDVDDGIVQAYNDDGQRYLTNASRVIHKGFEAAMFWEINDQFSLSSAYTQAKHEFDQHDKYSGNEMTMAPDYITNVRLRYQPSFLSGFTSMLEVQSIGEYWLDDANSQDDEGNSRTYDGYTIVNLKARYQISKKLALHARLLNLSDKEYAQEASHRYGKTTYSPGAPRTIYVGLNYQW
jgi:iron complex outermembrane receptor protein